MKHIQKYQCALKRQKSLGIENTEKLFVINVFFINRNVKGNKIMESTLGHPNIPELVFYVFTFAENNEVLFVQRNMIFPSQYEAEVTLHGRLSLSEQLQHVQMTFFFNKCTVQYAELILIYN